MVVGEKSFPLPTHPARTFFLMLRAEWPNEHEVAANQVERCEPPFRRYLHACIPGSNVSRARTFCEETIGVRPKQE